MGPGETLTRFQHGDRRLVFPEQSTLPGELIQAEYIECARTFRKILLCVGGQPDEEGTTTPLIRLKPGETLAHSFTTMSVYFNLTERRSEVPSFNVLCKFIRGYIGRTATEYRHESFGAPFQWEEFDAPDFVRNPDSEVPYDWSNDQNYNYVAAYLVPMIDDAQQSLNWIITSLLEPGINQEYIDRALNIFGDRVPQASA